MSQNFKRYCKNYQDIENYEKALADDFKGWHCHHRLETHTPDGKRREVDIGYKELKALNMYYNRPAEELIFLTIREHNTYQKRKPKSEETKKRISDAKKGKHLSEEHKNKIGAAIKGKQIGEKNPMYGKRHSEESKRKMSEAKKGKQTPWTKGNTNTKGTCWYNNGKINIMAKECPDGFTPGQLRK